MKNLFTSFFLFALLLNAAFSEAQVGNSAPDFTLNKLGGGTFTLSDQKDKVVFIYLFGYACPHCISNGPNTQSDIYSVYKNNSSFVAIGVDTWDGNESGVSNYKSTTGVDYQLCLMGSALETSYNSSYDRIIVVDKDGIIRFKATSDATKSIVAAASDTISKYLNKSAMGGMDNGGNDGGDTGGDDMGGDDSGTITAINDTDVKEKFVVYPVPAKEKITISGSALDHQTFDIKIVDVFGKVSLESRYSAAKQLDIPIDQLKEGVYFVQFNNPQQSFMKRILISR